MKGQTTMMYGVALLMIVGAVMMTGVAGEETTTVPEGVVALVRGYRDTLNADDCTGWAALFAEDGVKYDAPAPAVGRAEILAFCKAHRGATSAFAYAYAGAPLFTSSDGWRATVQWLIGGAEGTTGIVQTGWGSYTFVANASAPHGYYIAECTGYAITPWE